MRQGIIYSGGCTELRINALDKDDSNEKNKTIADAYGNKFIIPLDFEMLDSTMPYYQSWLENRLCYEIMFNDYNQVIVLPTELTTKGSRLQIQDFRHILRIRNCYPTRSHKSYRIEIPKNGFAI